MRFAILTIGDEILSGRTVDTNSAWIAKALNREGLELQEIRSIGDVADQIIKHLDDLKRSCEIVITTGGLGPTHDDLTKEVLAQYFNCQLSPNEEVLTHLKALVAKNKWPMRESHVRQAIMPEGIDFFLNNMGTASGLLFEQKGFMVLSLPGVPYEMKHLVEDRFLPYYRNRFERQIHIVHRNINTAGIGESALSQMIGEIVESMPSFIKLAYLPSPAKVTLRLSGKHNNRVELDQLLDRFQTEIYERVREYAYSMGEVSLEEKVGIMLKEGGYTLGLAESCTGGLVSHRITSVAGSSAYFEGAVVSYSNEVKSLTLGVAPQLIEHNGAVSEPVVMEMVRGAVNELNVNVAVAISGIAGPTGGSPSKPVGTIWIATGTEEKQKARKVHYAKNRAINIEYASTMALYLLFCFLRDEMS